MGIRDDLEAEIQNLRAERDGLLRIQEVTLDLASEHDTKRLLDRILDAAVSLSGAERGFVVLVESSRLRIRAARNIDREEVERPSFKVSRSVVEQVYKDRQALITTDAAEDSRFVGSTSVQMMGLRSVLCVPLKIQENCIGVLYLDNRFRAGVFQPTQLGLVEALAAQAAVSVQNAILFEENERRRDELEEANRKMRDLAARLERRVEHTTRRLKRARREIRRTRRGLEFKYRYDNIVGRSERMLEVFEILDRTTESDAPVFIHGEMGTGKELVGIAIHFNGPRKKKRYVPINCAAFPETLLEGELFGHRKGAFTGADRDKKGLFEIANGGTIFLDEVADMPPAMQAKLLRALQFGLVRPIGSEDEVKVDVRVVSATNRDLDEEVRKGRFREDLFYRLNVIRVELPPLRERREDIPLLLQHFLKRDGKAREIDADAVRRLECYEFPGNIRELENVVKRLVAFGGDPITLEDVERLCTFDGPRTERDEPVPGTLRSLEQLEIEHIRRVLASTGGNRTEAASVLGIDPSTLWRKLKKYDLGEGKES